MTRPADVTEEARSWVGVPFLHQGRSRRGVDCVGLPIVVCQALALIPSNFGLRAYGRTPSGELEQRLLEHCQQIERPVAGSLIVIAWTRLAAHVAICTGDAMIHAYESVGRVVEHGYRGRWTRMTHSAWRLPGVAYE
jgi:cell wall-associated NlpC family hydrolase